jgi:hypothetical protein
MRCTSLLATNRRGCYRNRFFETRRIARFNEWARQTREMME